jgi:hypothetical protein
MGRGGGITVGDHVSTAQGREGMPAGRTMMQPPPDAARSSAHASTAIRTQKVDRSMSLAMVTESAMAHENAA